MKILVSPMVSLLHMTSHLNLPDKFLSNWQPTASGVETLPEFAGRLCYLSFGGEEFDGHKAIKGRTSNEEYLNNIMQVAHGSVLEHSTFTFLFEGISRSLSHELVRHRHLSYSQLSQRYVDESEVAFVVPPELLFGIDEPVNTGYSIWERAMTTALQDYQDLLSRTLTQIGVQLAVRPTTSELKRARQTARSVLPNSTETKVVVTGNVRAWRHFLSLRATLAADAEIRRLSFHLWEILVGEAPALFNDFELHQDEKTGVQFLHSAVGLNGSI